jgi:hypothetical protein
MTDKQRNWIEEYITENLIDGLAYERRLDFEHMLLYGEERPLPGDASESELPVDRGADARDAHTESYRESLNRQLFSKKPGKVDRARAAGAILEGGKVFIPPMETTGRFIVTPIGYESDAAQRWMDEFESAREGGYGTVKAESWRLPNATTSLAATTGWRRREDVGGSWRYRRRSE